MDSRAPFNPADPFDALANHAKTEIAQTGVRLMESPEMKSAVLADIDYETAMLIGILTGACGIMMSQFVERDDIHMELRAAMIGSIPVAFNQARAIIGLPPLPEAN